MCAGRMHRYTVEVRVRGETHKVAVYATGVAEAVAKADGYAHIHFPGDFHTFTVTHSTYSSVEGALEHGAILPERHEPTWPDWVKALV